MKDQSGYEKYLAAIAFEREAASREFAKNPTVLEQMREMHRRYQHALYYLCNFCRHTDNNGTVVKTSLLIAEIEERMEEEFRMLTGEDHAPPLDEVFAKRRQLMKEKGL